MQDNNSLTVSVIILNYNGKRFLKDCLTSVLGTTYASFEVILVDNGSTDGSVEYVKSFFSDTRLKVVELPRNYGFAKGNNIGAKHARGKYIVCLNSDVFVDSEWLTPLVETMECDAKVGVAQAKILKIGGKKIDHAGGFLNPYGFVFVRGSGKIDRGQYDKVCEIFFAGGAAMMIRRDLWDKLGGFDPMFFLYFEDIDLCWRTWLNGDRVVFVPRSRVYHIGGATFKKYPYFLKFYEARNRLFTLIKNYSLRRLFKTLPVTLLMYILNCTRYVLVGEVTSTLAIFRGSLWAFKNLGEIWKRRTEIRRKHEEYVVRHLMIDRLF